MKVTQIPEHITLEFLEEVFVRHQLPETFGIKFTHVGKDSVCGELTVDERHLRPGGIMNGGVSLVLIETMGSISASCFVDLEKENPLGLQVSANHLAVAYPGDVLTARSSKVHVGRSTQIWDVLITNQDQKQICSGRITMMIAKRSLATN